MVPIRRRGMPIAVSMANSRSDATIAPESDWLVMTAPTSSPKADVKQMASPAPVMSSQCRRERYDNSSLV